MKRLNKEPRKLRPMNPSIYKWMADAPVKEQILLVKQFANMQLRETLSVSQSNKMQIELKIFKLKNDGKNFDNERFLMRAIDKNIEDINKVNKENDNYRSEYYEYEVFE
jgi:hypothetical protein